MDAAVFDATGGALTLGPGRYRALTKIRLRKEPDVAAEPTGDACFWRRVEKHNPCVFGVSGFGAACRVCAFCRSIHSNPTNMDVLIVMKIITLVHKAS